MLSCFFRIIRKQRSAELTAFQRQLLFLFFRIVNAYNTQEGGSTDPSNGTSSFYGLNPVGRGSHIVHYVIGYCLSYKLYNILKIIQSLNFQERLAREMAFFACHC